MCRNNPQRAYAANTLWHIFRGKPQCYSTGILCEVGNKTWCKAAFDKAPLHDTFRTTDDQLDPNIKYLFKKPHKAVHESKITIRFWIVTIILAALAIITLKIR